MPPRREDSKAVVPDIPLRVGLALREAFREGYSGRDLRADVTAGVVVGIVALPLAMAVAIASGVPPQPPQVLERAEFREEPGKLAICADDDEALLLVRLYLGLDDRPATPVAAS